MKNKKFELRDLKNQINTTNILWLSLFFLPYLILEAQINSILNFFNTYFQQPWSSLVGLILISVWFFKTSFSGKVQIVKWTAPLVFWSFSGLKFNGMWQINTAIIFFLAAYFVFVIAIIIDLILHKMSKTDKKQTNLGLISDDPIEKEVEENSFGRTQYAASIVSEIRKTVNKRAFNIAITGAWGSGKTSFLNLIKGEMEKEVDQEGKSHDIKFITVNYNPWDFKEDKIIGLDLLKTISHDLAQEKELQDQFKGLMSSLQNVDQSPWYKVIPYFLSGFSKEKSINEYRREIGETLKQDKKKLVIFLDDLDRLDGVEILEVFKTIRNSFDIANTFFVLGFDIDYVADQIEGIVKGDDGKQRAIEYLDKIFQMRLFMPSISDYSHYQEFKLLVKSYFNFDLTADIDWTFQINNKRKLLRLINSLKVFFNNENHEDYNFKALVQIESLKIIDPKFYNYIIENTDSILSKYNSIGSVNIYTDGRKSDDNSYQSIMNEFTGMGFKLNSRILLEQFFSGLDKQQNYRIRRDEFVKYFKYSLEKDEFSTAILNEAISSQNKVLILDSITENNRDSLIVKIDRILDESQNDWLQILFIEMLYNERKYLLLYGKKYDINNYTSYVSFEDLKTKIENLLLKDQIIFLTDLDNKNDEVNQFLMKLFTEFFDGNIDDIFWLVYHSLKANDLGIVEKFKQEFILITRETISKNYLEIFKSAVSIIPEGKNGGSRINHTDPSYYYLVGLFSSQDWLSLILEEKDDESPYSDINNWLINLDSENCGILNYTHVFGKDYFDRFSPLEESKLEEE